MTIEEAIGKLVLRDMLERQQEEEDGAEGVQMMTLHASKGEAVKLFVVARTGGITVEELKAYCKDNFTGYKVPKLIVLRESLPMTLVGKILRRELRDIT